LLYLEERAKGQDSELQTIYSYAPSAPQDQVLDKARTAYLKAAGVISDEVKELKELKKDDTSNGKRKDAVGEDCPVYVPLPFLLLLYISPPSSHHLFHSSAKYYAMRKLTL
jgi:hypothetical protein